MGLDSVEFIFAIEDAFAIAIPDNDAEQLRTPRLVIDYIATRVPSTTEGVCPSQRAFYRVRQAMTAAYGTARAQISPAAVLSDLLPDDRESAWARLRIELRAPEWPVLASGSRRHRTRSGPVDTVGELAGFLVERSPSLFLDSPDGWTRAQIAHVVHRLVRDELGVTDYTDDSEFVRDMGVD